MCVYVYMHMCTHEHSTHAAKKRVTDPLELESQLRAACLLTAELRSSGRAEAFLTAELSLQGCVPSFKWQLYCWKQINQVSQKEQVWRESCKQEHQKFLITEDHNRDERFRNGSQWSWLVEDRKYLVYSQGELHQSLHKFPWKHEWQCLELCLRSWKLKHLGYILPEDIFYKE